MASASQQKALATPSQLEPDRPFEDYAAARGPKKAQKLKLGFLKINKQLFADIGADLNLNRRSVYPRPALEYRVHNKQDKHIATLRADRRALYAQKSFPVNAFDKVSARIQTTLATSYQGVPEFAVGFEQVRPTWLIPVGAAALLLAGKSVSGSKTFAGSSVQLPAISQDPTVKGEVKAAISRHGNGLALAVQQLNGILRL